MAHGEPSPVSTHDLKNLAARRLGLPEPSSANTPEAVRSAFLRRLSEADFQPVPADVGAFLVLSGRQGGERTRLEAELRRQDEERLDVEVETFAAGFFDIPVGQRRLKWALLSKSCLGNSRLSARLNGLEAGLDVDPAVVHDPTRGVDALVSTIFDLFRLDPRSRTRLRQIRASALRADREKSGLFLTMAARRLKERFPRVAALAPELIEQLGTPVHAPQPQPRAMATPAVASSGNKGWAPGAAFVLILVSGVLRALSSLNSPTPTAPPPVVGPVPKFIATPTPVTPTPNGFSPRGQPFGPGPPPGAIRNPSARRATESIFNPTPDAVPPPGCRRTLYPQGSVPDGLNLTPRPPRGGMRPSERDAQGTVPGRRP
jgi:hypothetical protein